MLFAPGVPDRHPHAAVRTSWQGRVVTHVAQCVAHRRVRLLDLSASTGDDDGARTLFEHVSELFIHFREQGPASGTLYQLLYVVVSGKIVGSATAVEPFNRPLLGVHHD